MLRGGGGLYLRSARRATRCSAQVLNPPARRSVTLRFGQLQTLGTGGLATEAPSSLSVYEYDSPLPSSAQWNGGVAARAAVGDGARRRIRRPARLQHRRGHQPQRGRLRHAPICRNSRIRRSRRRRRARHRVSTRSDARVHAATAAITQNVSPRLDHASLAADLVQPALPARRVVRIQRHDRSRRARGSTAARLQHNPDGTVTYRSDQAQADELLQTPPDPSHDEGQLRVGYAGSEEQPSPVLKAIGYLVNDWQLSGVWTAATSSPYTVGFNYQIAVGEREREPDGFAGLRRRAFVSSAIAGGGCSQRSVSAVQHGIVPGTAGRQRGTRVGQQLSARLLPAGAGPVDRAKHPAPRRPEHSATRRPVQCAQSGGHHRPQHDAGIVERRPTRSPTWRRYSIRSRDC